MIQDTSTEAYDSLTDEQKARMSRLVEAYIVARGPVCDREIARDLHFLISSVTPTRGELVKKGKVAEAFRDISPVSGKRVIFWMATANAIEEHHNGQPA